MCGDPDTCADIELFGWSFPHRAIFFDCTDAPPCAMTPMCMCGAE